LLETGGVAAYEPETMAAFLAAITFKQAAVAFDVGANVGVYSLVGGATTSAHIVGFEPTPDLARTFRAIAQANALSCTVEPIALGARTGRATLYLSASTDSSNSLDAGFRRAIGTVEVPLERLDDYVARTGLVPAVMKIDTESTEPDVLAGGSELLRVHRPWIVCEVLAGLTETGLEEVLRPLGYHFNQLGPGLPKPASAIVGDPTYLNRDWLFTPEPISADYQVHFAAWRSAIAAI
jgi:FkbM family methyltransferase